MTTVTTGGGGINRLMSRAKDALKHRAKNAQMRDVERDFETTRSMLGSFIGEGRVRENGKGKALFISFTNVPVFAKVEALMAKSLQLRGYSPVIVTLSNFDRARRYFELFGFDQFVFWDKLETAGVSESEYADRARELVPELKPSAIKSFQYRGVLVGRHALSRVLRDEVKGRLDLNDPVQSALIYKELARAIRNTDLGNEIMETLQPSVCFVREFGYTPHAQPFAVAVNRGIAGVNWHPGQRSGTWVFKRHLDISDPKIHLSISDATWSDLKTRPWLEHQEKLLQQEFEGRYRPDSKHDTRCIQEGKRFKTREEVQKQLGLDPDKKTAVLFSHITWDAAFFYGKDLFEDFEHWLLETVRAAYANSNVNWIIKLHPANVLKLKQKSSGGEMSELTTLKQLGPLPDHIKILFPDTDINTWSLYSVADYGLTVRGTVGFEMPCFGIPVLTAGTGGYSGFGFTIESGSAAEYLERLRTIQTIPRLSEAQIELAKKHAYYLWVERQISFEDVAQMTHLPSDRASHPLQTNVEYKLSSLSDVETSPSLSVFADWIQMESTPDLLAAPDGELSLAQV